MSQGPEWEKSDAPVPPAAPRPMSLGTVFEVGTRILRRHWVVLLVVSLLLVGPGALLTSAMALRFSETFLSLFPELGSGVIETDRVFSASELRRAFEALVPFLGASLLAGVLGSVGALAFSAAVAEDYHARPADLGPVLRACLRRVPSALAFMLVTALLISGLVVSGLLGMSVATVLVPAASVGTGGPGVFLALVIGVGLALAVVYLTMRWAPAYPAMVEEGAGWRAALRRSWYLSGDNVLRIFAVSLVVALITAIVSSILGALFEGVLSALLAPFLAAHEAVASTLGLALASVVVAPAMAVFTAVLYFDLRARRDVLTAPAAALER
jgi:Membrane domain of glycerophosphoryl diester phosphodiesterase